MVKRRIKQGCLYSFLIGLIFNIFVFIFADKILYILYHTNKGLKYFKILSPFFLIFYLEGPLISALQALNKASVSFKISTIGIILKLISLSIFSLMHIGLYSLVISEIINILFVVTSCMIETKKSLNY